MCRVAGLGLQPGGSCQEILTELLLGSDRITILPSQGAPTLLSNTWPDLETEYLVGSPPHVPASQVHRSPWSNTLDENAALLEEDTVNCAIS
jgi:hypothetical protein